MNANINYQIAIQIKLYSQGFDVCLNSIFRRFLDIIDAGLIENFFHDPFLFLNQNFGNTWSLILKIDMNEIIISLQFDTE